MNIYGDCHLHTTYSDGKGTPEEMIASAKEKGLSVIGFSDHSTLPYRNDWTIREEPVYRTAIHALRDAHPEMTILCGIEWDSSSRIDMDAYDYRISAVHCIKRGETYFEYDASSALFSDLLKKEYQNDADALVRDYYREVVTAALRPRVTFIAHFDLVTKFNENNVFFDMQSDTYLRHALTALHDIVSSRPQLPFEMNTGAITRGYRTSPYPSMPILSAMHEQHVPVLLSSDSHSPRHIAAHFDLCTELLREAGYRSVLVLNKYGFDEVGIC